MVVPNGAFVESSSGQRCRTSQNISRAPHPALPIHDKARSQGGVSHKLDEQGSQEVREGSTPGTGACAVVAGDGASYFCMGTLKADTPAEQHLLCDLACTISLLISRLCHELDNEPCYTMDLHASHVAQVGMHDHLAWEYMQGPAYIPMLGGKAHR